MHRTARQKPCVWHCLTDKNRHAKAHSTWWQSAGLQSSDIRNMTVAVAENHHRPVPELRSVTLNWKLRRSVMRTVVMKRAATSALHIALANGYCSRVPCERQRRHPPLCQVRGRRCATDLYPLVVRVDCGTLREKVC